MTKFLIATAVTIIWPLVCTHAQKLDGYFSTQEQIAADFQSVPCSDSERLNAVKALLERVNSSAFTATTDQYKNVENLLIRKPGSSQDVLVVGAHYDKVAEGCGAFDNWTGIVALAHLYRTVQNLPMKKTVLFVAFGKEEKGLIGSRAMARAIPKEQLSSYCAMINLDSLGLGAPQAPDNMSHKKLVAVAAELSTKMKIPFGHVGIGGAASDSNSFLERQIPALTIHGMTDKWPTILHSKNDQGAAVNSLSVYAGYRLALALLMQLDNAPCDTFR